MSSLKSRLYPLICLVLACSGTHSAHALRTALFPDSIRDRAAVWQDQDRVFQGETPTQTQRPIWIHGGDSIATSWANGGSLEDLRKRAAEEELPNPNSLRELFNNIPKVPLTWYAGTQEGGIFSFLENSSRSQWVVISTALAGAMLSQKDLNPLKIPLEVKNPERVEVITLSIGGNDLCELNDPFASPDTHPLKNLEHLKKHFPKAKIFILAPPPVTQVYANIQSQLDKLPESISKHRVQRFCQDTWENLYCPKGGLRYERESTELREKILKSYQDSGSHVIDLFQESSAPNVLEAISNDCFHPSKTGQDRLFMEHKKAIQRVLGLP